MAVGTTPEIRPEQRAAALAGSRYELIPIRGMLDEAKKLPAGAAIAVTCSPRHGIERTLEGAIALKAAGFHAIPHIAARLLRNPQEVEAVMTRIHQAGFDDVYVIAGDIDTPAGEFASALPVLEIISRMETRPTHIGIPGYPEGHALIGEAVLDEAISAKMAHADYVVTQMCFDPDRIGAWLRRHAAPQTGLTAWIGVPGVLETRRLLSISLKIGVGQSLKSLRRNQGLTGQLLHGHYTPEALIDALLPVVADPMVQVSGFHLNTFNTIGPLLDWRATFLGAAKTRG